MAEAECSLIPDTGLEMTAWKQLDGSGSARACVCEGWGDPRNNQEMTEKAGRDPITKHLIWHVRVLKSDSEIRGFFCKQ